MIWLLYVSNVIFIVRATTDISITDISEQRKPNPEDEGKTFGCYIDKLTYKAARFHMSSTPSSFYGDSIDIGWKFNSIEEFNLVYPVIEDMRISALKSCTTDTVRPFNRKYYLEFNKADYPNHYIGCLLSFYQKIIDKYPAVRRYFVMASVDLDVSPSLLQESLLVSRPSANFENDHLVGVIRFRINNDTGFIVIDLGLVIAPAPVIMFSESHKAHKPEAYSCGSKYVYTLKGNHIYSYIYAERFDLKNPQTDTKPNRTFLIYAQRSFCTFMSLYKSTFFKTKLGIYTYLGSGYYKAYCTVTLNDRKGYIELNNAGVIMQGVTELTLQNLEIASETQRIWLEQISVNLGFEKDGLYKVLVELRNIWTKNYTYIEHFLEFVEEVEKGKGKPKKPDSNPSLTSRAMSILRN